MGRRDWRDVGGLETGLFTVGENVWLMSLMRRGDALHAAAPPDVTQSSDVTHDRRPTGKLRIDALNLGDVGKSARLMLEKRLGELKRGDVGVSDMSDAELLVGGVGESADDEVESKTDSSKRACVLIRWRACSISTSAVSLSPLRLHT